MSLEIHENRLRDVLSVIEDARMPHFGARDVAQNIKSAIQGWEHLEASLTGLHRDMETAVGIVESLLVEAGPHQTARLQMLEHFQHDLNQIRVSEELLQQSMDTLYAQYYELI
ncbi:hypothetical protein GCM10022631_01540 [Deinococcus rubellus]